MSSDITVRVDEGVINLRVGAVITKENKVLMTKNPRDDYYYSVGGRIKIGETSEQAVIREVYEELGVKLPVDRLGFINENYFYGDIGDGKERQIYEICFYYYMKTPADYEPRVNSVTNGGITETFEWIPFDTDKTIYPVFFKTELYEPCETVKHIISDERIKNKE
jgi:8-oxo-dGTP pyrophosphatase MutT (NUDIX family)